MEDDKKLLCNHVLKDFARRFRKNISVFEVQGEGSSNTLEYNKYRTLD